MGNNLRKNIIVVLSALAILLLGCVAAYAVDDGFDYQWDGYICKITMPNELTEGADLTCPGGTLHESDMTAGETIELDLTDYVKSEFDNGSKACQVSIMYSVGEEASIFEINNTFYAIDTELYASKAADQDTELTVAIDSVQMLSWYTETGDFERLTQEQLEQYLSWAENSLVIRKGETSVQGRVVLNMQNSVYRGYDPLFEDGFSQVIFLKLADNSLINDQGKWGIIKCRSYDEKLINLGEWDNSPERFMSKCGPVHKACYTIGQDAEIEALDEFIVGLQAADKMIFKDRVNTGDKSLL